LSGDLNGTKEEGEESEVRCKSHCVGANQGSKVLHWFC
jgi:hypothetical protein